MMKLEISNGVPHKNLHGVLEFYSVFDKKMSKRI